jgi:hypothetical protein
MNLEELKNKFERVKIRHYNDVIKDADGNFIEYGYRATHCALVKDGIVYVGIALVNPVDQFSRKRGIAIATGRAYSEFEIATEKKISNGEKKWQHHVICADKEDVDAVLEKEIFSGPYYLEEVVVEEGTSAENACCGNCCGGCHKKS